MASLALPFLPGNADVKPGDTLMTSGLGGVFPAGYPVAKVAEVHRDAVQPLAQVRATPFANIETDHEVILVWYREDNPAAPAPPVTPTGDLRTGNRKLQPQPAPPPRPKPAPPAAPSAAQPAGSPATQQAQPQTAPGIPAPPAGTGPRNPTSTPGAVNPAGHAPSNPGTSASPLPTTPAPTSDDSTSVAPNASKPPQPTPPAQSPDATPRNP